MVGAGKTKVFQTTRAPMNSFGSMGALKSENTENTEKY